MLHLAPCTTKCTNRVINFQFPCLQNYKPHNHQVPGNRSIITGSDGNLQRRMVRGQQRPPIIRYTETFPDRVFEFRKSRSEDKVPVPAIIVVCYDGNASNHHHRSVDQRV